MKTEAEIIAILTPWTPALCTSAQLEGWDLFTTSDSTSDVQVQRIDDPGALIGGKEVPHLPSDSFALAMVRCGTGEHHKVARQILHDHFPVEWALMEKCYAEEMEKP